MNFENENNAEERRKTDTPAGRQTAEDSEGKPRRRRSGKGKTPPSPEVGHALRNIYQRTIEEDVPSEMLDLLSKLG